MKKNKGIQSKKNAKRDEKVSRNNLKIVIQVENISKIFKIPHKRIDSLRTAFINVFRKNIYENFYALKNISFNVKKGEFLGIIGKNGAGKSTLLKILAEVYRPTTGRLKVYGKMAPFLELGIGFNPELSGRDNIYLNATVLGLSKKQIDEKFDEIVKFAELKEFIDEQLKNYSSGMKARLAFSVSIHADREILLMDEVLAVGDNKFQNKCLNIFKGYKKQGKTVILVTHSIETVRKYCDRALLLHKGRMTNVGDVNDVCDAYIKENMSVEARKELEKIEKIKKEGKQRERKIKQQQEKEAREKRLQEEKKIREKKIQEKKVQEKNKKEITKYGKIIDLKVCDLQNRKIKEIRQGDDVKIIVEIYVKEVCKKMILAIQIFDKDTNYFICGNNIRNSNFKYKWKKGINHLSLILKNTMFNKGTIYCRGVLSNCKTSREGNVLQVYPDVDKKQIMQDVTIIQEAGTGGGIMRIEHEWKSSNKQ